MWIGKCIIQRLEPVISLCVLSQVSSQQPLPGRTTSTHELHCALEVHQTLCSSADDVTMLHAIPSTVLGRQVTDTCPVAGSFVLCLPSAIGRRVHTVKTLPARSSNHVLSCPAYRWIQSPLRFHLSCLQANDFDDLSGAQELALGELVAEKFGSDFFFLDRFPTQIRPFYTMPCPDDNR